MGITGVGGTQTGGGRVAASIENSESGGGDWRLKREVQRCWAPEKWCDGHEMEAYPDGDASATTAEMTFVVVCVLYVEWSVNRCEQAGMCGGVGGGAAVTSAPPRTAVCG